MLSSYVSFPPFHPSTSKKNEKRRVFCCTSHKQFTLTDLYLKQLTHSTKNLTNNALQPIFVRFLKWHFVKVRLSKSVQLRTAKFRIQNPKLPLWSRVNRIGEYTILCRYVSQKGPKSCTTGYLSFIGQDANKTIPKNTLKARLCKGFKPFLKSVLCHTTSCKKIVFCRSTSYKMGTILEIQEPLILVLQPTYSNLHVCQALQGARRYLIFNFVSLRITR